MADWLLIRLARQPAAPASWLVADAAGRIVAREQQGALSEAAALAPSRRVCALVPAADVVLTEADVPIKSGVKAQQVVPFALEEQLADDVETLHFALGRRASEGARMPVAVVSRALLESWLAELEAAGLKPEAVFSESELAPANPGQAVAVLEGDDAIVRAPGALPVTMPIDALPEALRLAGPGSEEVIAAEPPGGRGLVLYTGAAEWHQHARVVESLRDRFDGIKVQLLTEGPLPLYAQRLASAAAGGAINLLQGSYAPASSLGSGWRIWRVAAILLVAVVALHAIGSAAELMSLTRAERKVNVAIDQTFRAAMPGEHNAIDARRRMAQRLVKLRGGESSGLLAALDALAEVRVSAGDTAIRALQFRDGALDLVLAAPSAESLDRLSQGLRARGWQANLISSNTSGSRYEGRIEIKPRA
ncbi:MAG: type II secretion system protein GspL [Steroidobacteraceae bacterium]